MPAPSDRNEYVILPARGITAPPEQATAASFLASLKTEAPQPDMDVVDSIHENGAKLVRMSAESLPQLRARQPGIRIVPVRYYRQMTARKSVKPTATVQSASTPSIPVRVTGAGGAGVANVKLVAFTDYDNRLGVEAVTDKEGQANLKLGASPKKIERLYLYPASGYWPGLQKAVTLTKGMAFALPPIDLTFQDCVRVFAGGGDLTAGHGLTVGVIDSGIAAGKDLTVAGGRNTVTGEAPGEFGDNGTEGHGTHVAGIIAAHGAIHGVAPGVVLRSYRVFGKGSATASSFAIAKAIDAAVADGCDLINMSLGQPDPDETMTEAIASALAKGALVFAANGNDGASSPSFPASDDLCIAVSAMGRKGTFPDGSEPEGSITKTVGTDKKNFMAEFSNVGATTDLVGAGVGVISTVPGGYGVMSGTSMACPVKTGMAARILQNEAGILAMPRNQARSDAMKSAVMKHAKKMGFGATNEGVGMLQP